MRRIRVRSTFNLVTNRSLASCRGLDLQNDRLQKYTTGTSLNQKRHAFFLATVVRSIIARATVVLGGLGIAGYAIDEKVRSWEENTYRPLVNQLDKFKEITRPGLQAGQEYLLSIRDKFKITEDILISDIQELKAVIEKTESKSSNYDSEYSDSKSSKNDEKRKSEIPKTIVPIIAAAAILRNENEDDKEKELLTAELASLSTELSTLQSLRRDLEKTIDNLSSDEQNHEVLRLEMMNQIRELQDAASTQEVRHHKKVEKLESEVNDLYTRLAQAQNQAKIVSSGIASPKSLVELYSTVLDELEHAKVVCPNVQSPDLPRVVVVGDQSSGKTSVLEAVARARIFPRGAGQMMTRSPVKVTIMDGPRHIASFPSDPKKIYRLDDESDLAKLRLEIEARMNRACRGVTVSSEVVPINIQGPGLRRMVLVDLPGIIATETAGIVPGTSQEIINLANEQMSYPNAIILCVQDGSVDAERSQVTNFVRQADPSGERTLLVLTKVDRAVADPVRLKQILDGKLLPLRALGYFAVVSGTDDRDASIGSIRKYENDFFQSSKMLRSGILKVEQLGTQNMCDAVSKIFWNLVKSSIKVELAKLKEQLFMLDSEWKNKYRRERELDREELFQKGKDSLLDKIVELQNLDPGEFESELRERLWRDVRDNFLKEVYLAAEGGSKDKAEFNTISDIRLRNFTNTTLPSLSIQAANSLLIEKFQNIILPNQAQGFGLKDESALFFDLFERIKKEAAGNFTRFSDSIKTERSADLKIIQQSTIDNHFIQSQTEWESSCDRLTDALTADLVKRWEKVNELAGPRWYSQYYNWTSRTEEQFKWDRIKRALEIVPLDTPLRLSKDEVSKARFSIEKRYKIEVSESDIDDAWNDFYPTRWIQDLQYRAVDCKRCYYKYKSNQISSKRSRLQCDDVLLWWRMERTIEMTAANLRQKMLTDDGVQKLSDELKSVLASITEEEVVKLITGRQVDLAEELKYIRKIHGLLKELHELLQRVGA